MFMRKYMLMAGIVFLLIGIFVMDQGTQVLTPLASETGLTSHTIDRRVLYAETVLAVGPESQRSVEIQVDSGAQVAGSFQVGAGRQMDFYVMKASDYSNWNADRPAAVVFFKLDASSCKFNFTLVTAGSYYFVFENQENVRGTVVFQVDTMTDVFTINPVVEYIPFALLALGILFLGLGVTGGQKKPQPMKPGAKSVVARPTAPVPTVNPLPTVGWKCKFCGSGNPIKDQFCKTCGRSKQ
jgi:hypothetical protein